MPDRPAQTLRIVRAASRRALVAGWLRFGGVALVIGSATALLLIGVDRAAGGFIHWGLLVAIPLGLALAAAAVLALLHRWSPLHAAVELDHRLGSKDTLASALSLAADDGDAFSSWTIQEAEILAGQVEVRRLISLDLRWHWAGWPALVAAAIAAGLYLPALDWSREHPASPAGPQRQAATEQVRLAQVAARSVLDEQHMDEATRRELDVLEQLERELEAGSADPAQAGARAARQLNQLGDSLESRAEVERRSRDEMRDRLAAVRRGDQPAAPSREQSEQLAAMADAVNRGDFESAAEIARQALEQERSWSNEERRRAAEDLEELAEALRNAQQSTPIERQPGRSGELQPPEPASEPQPSEPQPAGQAPEPQPSEPPTEEPTAGQQPERQPDQPPQDQRTDPREIERELREQGLDAEQARREAERRAQENRQRQAEERARQRLEELERSMRETARDLREQPPEQQQGQPGQEQERPPQSGQQQDQQSERRGTEEQQQPGAQEQRAQEQQQQGQPEPRPGQQEQGQQPGQQERPQPTQQPSQQPGQQQEPDQPGTEPRPGSEPQTQPGESPGEQSGAQPRPQPGQERPGGEQEGAQPEPGAAEPGAQPEPQPGQQPGAGEQPQGEQESQQPGGQPDARGMERLRRAFEQMTEEGRQADRMQEQSRQLREMAERMLRDMSPEEREELRQMAEEMQRRGHQPPPGAGDGAGEQPHPGIADRPTAPHRGGVDPVDARPGEGPPRTPQQRERILAEWFGEGEQTDPSGRGIPPAAMREAAQSAERSIEQQPIPPRYADLVRRVLRRYSEQPEAPQ